MNLSGNFSGNLQPINGDVLGPSPPQRFDPFLRRIDGLHKRFSCHFRVEEAGGVFRRPVFPEDMSLRMLNLCLFHRSLCHVSLLCLSNLIIQRGQPDTAAGSAVSVSGGAGFDLGSLQPFLPYAIGAVVLTVLYMGYNMGNQRRY